MENRNRYEVLDALRGLCAIAVVALHYFESYKRWEVIPHSHLAVEYFFLLTGFTFVIAYDRRWKDGTMTVLGFLWRRFLRLWPIVFIGSVIGLMFCFALNGRFFSSMPNDPWIEFQRFLYSLTMLPWCGKGCMTQMQPQTWTLLYIIYANLIYLFILRFFRTWMLGIALLAAAGYSYYVAAHYHSFALGWDFTHHHIVTAAARMSFPVLAGMFIARCGWRISFPGAGVFAAAVLGFILYSPVFPKTGEAFGWYELIAVLVALPLVLLTGAGGSIPSGRFADFCAFMGRFSFPLYATHFPLRIVLRNWIQDNPSAPYSRHVAMMIAIVAATIALAWIGMKFAEWFAARCGAIGKKR